MNLLTNLKNEGTVIMATHDTVILNKFKSRTIICTDNTVTERQDTVLNFINLEEQMEALFDLKIDKQDNLEQSDSKTIN